MAPLITRRGLALGATALAALPRAARAADDTIKIGVMTPLTGASVESGKQQQNGLKIALEAVNLKGVLYGIAAALPHMQRQRSGQIINVSSVAGHKVRAGSTVYAATKVAVRALSEGLRQEVKPYGIRTTVISPGSVATELLDGISEPDVAASVRQRVAPVALPAESFARLVAFAISQPEDVDVNEILFRPTRQEF